MEAEPTSGQPGLGGHVRTFVRGSAGLGVALAVRAAGSLALNKLVVLYGGPGSLTQLAQFQNLMALFTTLPAEGVQVGAITYLAPLRPGQPRYGRWLGAAFWLTAALIGASGLGLAEWGGAGWPLGRVVVFTGLLLVVAWQALLSAALLAAGQLRKYLGLTVGLTGLSTAAVAGLLAVGRPLSQVLLGYVAGQALAFGLALWLGRRAGLLRGGWRPQRPSPVALRGLSRFLLIALGSLLFGRAVDYELRAYLIAHFAPAATDLWQAVEKLSDGYSPLVGAVLSAVFYPRLAALAPRPAEQRRYVTAVAGLLALGLGLGFGLLFLGRKWLLALLFAPPLAAAAPLLAPQLVGDWAKFLTWVFQYTLLVRAQAGTYLAVQAVGTALRVALLAALLPPLGLPGLVLAHAADYALTLLLCVLWYYGWAARSSTAQPA